MTIPNCRVQPRLGGEKGGRDPIREGPDRREGGTPWEGGTPAERREGGTPWQAEYEAVGIPDPQKPRDQVGVADPQEATHQTPTKPRHLPENEKHSNQRSTVKAQ